MMMSDVLPKSLLNIHFFFVLNTVLQLLYAEKSKTRTLWNLPQHLHRKESHTPASLGSLAHQPYYLERKLVHKLLHDIVFQNAESSGLLVGSASGWGGGHCSPGYVQHTKLLEKASPAECISTLYLWWVHGGTLLLHCRTTVKHLLCLSRDTQKPVMLSDASQAYLGYCVTPSN
jgi:hypothetical protein